MGRRGMVVSPIYKGKGNRVTSVGARHWGYDVVAWTLAIIIALTLRYDFEAASIHWREALALIAIMAAVQLVAGMLGHVYQSRYILCSFEESLRVGLVTTAAGLAVGLLSVFVGPIVGLPRSSVLLATPIALLNMMVWRYLSRLITEQRVVTAKDQTAPALIYGAGDMGANMVQRLRTDTSSPYRVVGLIDDDPGKRNLHVRDATVLGTLKDLPQIANETGATVLIVAIVDTSAALMRRVASIAAQAGVEVKIAPALNRGFFDEVRIGNVRNVTIEDYIGRSPVGLNTDSIAGYLMKKRVLVTGGGGSIGRELCRQLSEYGPAELVVLDHDETNLQGTEFALYKTGLLDRPDIVLADIRDPEAVMAVFRDHRPEVVFHAAALKHVPMLQRFPREAWETNVLGTLNVLRAAQAVGVERFINISTDKAADPTTVLGHSKRVAEKLTAWMGEATGRHYSSVRFGNVFGSRGSMVPLFQMMIDAGLPITLTHPDATRYFMTIAEACQLVIQAGSFDGHGDVFILDMGRPVKIREIAERMIALSGKPIEIRISGLREGEKIHEDLISEREQDQVVWPHDKIAQAQIESLAPGRLDYDEWLGRCQAQAALCDLLSTAESCPDNKVSVRDRAVLAGSR